ncbi:MAG: hypothetical protein ACRD5L_04695 [Bryobacteraceae bacterium]
MEIAAALPAALRTWAGAAKKSANAIVAVATEPQMATDQKPAKPSRKTSAAKEGKREGASS